MSICNISICALQTLVLNSVDDLACATWSYKFITNTLTQVHLHILLSDVYTVRHNYRTP